MTPERWRQITEIFHATLAREPERQSGFLADACGDDVSLRLEVESLMAGHHQAGAFGEAPLPAVERRLLPGASLGSYRIERLIDAGGMGEVYRATDTKLGREVAIKVLPPDVAADPERLARFTREAQLLASLNHPHIAAIYGIEDTTDVRALVLELVDGETLARHLSRSTLPITEALRLAMQIAEALAAAHARGIVHRDLKPANVMITSAGVVKVLDFGLAKLAATRLPDPDHTLSTVGTREGAIVGTPAYMSPEQARGRPVDKQTDIWAFGCCLYEMLTGRAAFGGNTASDSLVKVLEREPDWSALSEQTPVGIRRLLRRCLEKNPADRLRDIGDARLEILDASTSNGERPGNKTSGLSRARLIAWGTAASLAAVVLVFVVMSGGDPRQQSDGGVVQFQLTLPANVVPSYASVSPDGRQIAFDAFDGRQAIWLRSLDSADAHRVDGAERGWQPFWSPDGSRLGFFATSQLKVIDAVGGGPAVVMGSAPVHQGGSFNRDGTIVFASDSGLFTIPASGGTAAALAIDDSTPGRAYRSFPQFLADQRHFIYHTSSNAGGAVRIGSLGSSSTTHLVDSPYPASYAEPYLFFVRGTALMVQRLDPSTRALLGTAAVVVRNVVPRSLAALPVFSASGPRVFTAKTVGSESGAQLEWFDRGGHSVGAIKQPRGVEYINPALSTKDDRVAVNRMDPETGNWDIWILDNTRGIESRVTLDPAQDSDAIWSPDGKDVVFGSTRRGHGALYRKAVDSTEPEQLLAEMEGFRGMIPTDWSPDGRFILFSPSTASGVASSVWVLPVGPQGRPAPLLQGSGFVQYGARFSPDGKWFAYASGESGNFEVYVQPFMRAGPKIQVSKGGGTHPRWTRNGRELVYLVPGGGIAVTDVALDEKAVRVGAPTVVVSTPVLEATDFRTHYDVTLDGQRFLVRRPTGAGSPALTVMMNWASGLKR